MHDLHPGSEKIHTACAIGYSKGGSVLHLLLAQIPPVLGQILADKGNRPALPTAEGLLPMMGHLFHLEARRLKERPHSSMDLRVLPCWTGIMYGDGAVPARDIFFRQGLLCENAVHILCM